MPDIRQYETTYILMPELDEGERNKVKERFANVIEQQFGGSIVKVDEWGRRPLAYKIKKESSGYYICTRYDAPGDAVAELERILRLADPVMKFLTVRIEDSGSDDEGAED